MADAIRRWSREFHESGRISADVVQRIHRERVAHLVGLAAGWVVSLAFVALCGTLFVRHEGPALRAIIVFAAATALFVMSWTTWLETTLNRAQSNSLGDLLAEKRHRLEQEIAVESAWWPLVVVVVALAGWVPWKVMEDWVSVLMVLLIGVAVLQVQRLRKDQRKLSTLLRLMSEVDGGWDSRHR